MDPLESELSSNGNEPLVPPLFAHQLATIQHQSPILFDTSDPGTGKTRAHAERFERRRKRGGKCALVIAPKSILRSAWGNDIQRFTTLSVSIAYASNRDDAFTQPADIYITNTDATKWLVKQPKKFYDKFDTLIIDESSFFKHHTSNRSRALAKIAKLFPYRALLTGTPNSNSITDLWHQLFLLDEGVRLGSSFYAFRAACCAPTQVGPSAQMVQWRDKPGVEGSVAAIISDITIRNKLEECVDIPENFTYVSSFFLEPGVRRAYKAFGKDAIIKLQSGTVSAVNKAVLTKKLLQICSGAVYESEHVYHVLDKTRYDYVLDLVEQRAHSIVFFEWKHERDQLTDAATKRGLTYAYIDGTVNDNDRATIIDNYQKGFFQTLFLHPQSAGHGVTLTKGTSTIWTHPTYNLEHFAQGNRRIYRAGQVQKTETVVIVAADTIEGRVYQALMDKNVKMLDLLEMLR